MHHYRKTVKTYDRLNKIDAKDSIECSFCHTMKGNRIAENQTMILIENRVPYDIFETRRTTGEHYLIVPKRHIEKLEDFTDAEKLDYMSLLSEYEAKGFNIYVRGQGNISRSQAHQHTHLIKLLNKRPKLHLYISKPYFVAHID